MKKRALALILALVMLCTLFTACGTTAAPPAATAAPAAAPAPTEPAVPATRSFTDDCGRTLELPATIEKVAVSGPLAQVYTLPICLDMYVGFCSAFSGDAAKYINSAYLDLPELGQLYGGKGTMDLEALLAADPDVVIDVGEAKKNIVEDLDGLTEQTGIPFIHIDATVQSAPQAYRRLGELLGREEQAEALAQWCETMYADVEGVMAKVDEAGERKTIAYLLGDKGLNALADGSFHAETLAMVAKNIVEVSEVASSGMGNEIDMEQLMLWDPDVIVFADNSIYATVLTEEQWQQLTAVQSGEVFEAPHGPYGWLASPPAVQRYLGMIWLCGLLYPDMADYDLQEKVTEYYKLFYGYDLSDADYAELTANAVRK